MSWDPQWENIFCSRGWSRYPLESLIRFVARHYYQVSERSKVSFLELGCGEGNNVWYLAREGFDVYGLDGSATAINKAEQRLQAEGLTAHLQTGDVIRLAEIYSCLRFDVIINAGCLQHNRFAAVQSALVQARGLLKSGGRMFSTMIATGSYGDGLGDEVEPGTYTNISDGHLAGLGLCHFFTLDEVQELFSGFSEVQIECAISSADHRRQEYKHWIVEATAANNTV